MERNRYISGVKVLFGAALILSTVERSSSLDGLLRCAARSGNEDLAVFFVSSHNANINAVDVERKTALHHAVKCGNREIVSFFISQGGDPNAVDAQGYNALHYAILSRNIGIIDLLAPRMDINRVDLSGNSPINAVYSSRKANAIKQVDVIKRLRFYGADVNIRNRCGFALLHLAVRVGDVDSVEYLMREQAETNWANGSGQTPLDMALDMALRANHTDSDIRIVFLLLEYFAVTNKYTVVEGRQGGDDHILIGRAYPHSKDHTYSIKKI
ncbi:MAG: ankyrin repeat domain-containing protein [Holosporaceae bacterium]|jgi:ankyrin repeat protein|nr:ankyrin repeat domain-containing protein [Holosporaceae bacterium]